MSDIFAIILIVGGLWTVIASLIETGVANTNGCGTIFFPNDIYDITEMNWFGCITIYIILFPIAFIYEIGGFLKWLFTVGRKD